MSWAIFGAGVQWNQNGMAHTAEEMANQVLSLIAGGLYGSVEDLQSGGIKIDQHWK